MAETFFSKILARLKGKKQPAKPPQQPGARGQATGWSDAEIARRFPQQPFARYVEIPDDDMAAFLKGEQPLFVLSSNVGAAIQYFPDDHKMSVEYHGGREDQRAYLYDNISVAEAEDFARAGSKGRWVWSNIRVRGKGNAHLTQKPFVRLR
jgi:hypothetical protein